MKRLILFLIFVYYTVYDKFFCLHHQVPKLRYWRYTFGFNGLVVPLYGIIINKSLKNHPKLNNLIDHEQVHWMQFKKWSIPVMLIMYIYEIIRFGYDKSPLEIEARFNECEFVKTNYTLGVRIGIANTPHNPNFRVRFRWFYQLFNINYRYTLLKYKI